MHASVLFAGPERKPGACEIYRGNIPMYYLGTKDKRWKTSWYFLQRILTQALFGQLDLEAFLSTIDVLVFPRFYVPKHLEGSRQLEAFFKVIRDLVKVIVYETDDDYTNEHRQVIDGSALAVLSMCDGITVTTPYLGEIMKKRVNKPYYVLPNMLEPKIWKFGKNKRKLGTDYVVIALTGSPSHYQDWYVLKDVLPRLLKRHEHVRLIVAGLKPDYLDNLPQTEYYEGFAYSDYAQVIQQCDVVLAPVDPNDGFNMGKSPIKAVEGMGAGRKLNNEWSGAAVLATDNPIYRLAVDHEVTGLLLPYEPQLWYDALERTVLDHAFRHSLQREGWLHVWKHFDISNGWRLWKNAYEAMLSKRQSRLAMS